jgi:peptide/nickel transport system substrate-binding protein
MVRDERSHGGGWGKAIILGLICLGIGLAAGRMGTGRKDAVERRWMEVDELHQMFLEPSSFNFIESNKSYENQLLALIHDHLLTYDPAQNELTPALARSYEASADGLTWTFHLRPAETPDGLALSADDVVFSFNLGMDRRFDNKRRGNFILKGKPVKATAIDPLTVKFALAEPFHTFPWALAGVTIVPKATFAPVSENEKTFRQAVGVQQPDPKYVRGFGPYAVESQDTQEIRLVRNDRYWGRGDDGAPRPYLRRIILVLRKEDMTRELDFARDERFIYRLIGPMEADRLREDIRFDILDRGRSGGCMFFWLNQNPRAPWGQTYPARMKLFQNVAFRRAIARAIDRTEIIRRVFKGYADPIYGPVSPIYRWAAPLETLKEVTPATDPQAALTELAKLGVTPGEADSDGKRWLTYEEGGKRIPLEIEIRTSRDEEDRRRKTAEVIKTQLERIGLRVNVVEERFGLMVMRLDKTFDYEAAVMMLEGTPDAAELRFFFESSGPMHFVNPYQKSPATDWEKRVDELFALYATAPEATVRDRAIIDLQKTWVAAQPAFHLYNDRKLVAVRRDYEVNGLVLTGRARDPILERTIIENVRLRRLAVR